MLLIKAFHRYHYARKIHAHLAAIAISIFDSSKIYQVEKLRNFALLSSRSTDPFQQNISGYTYRIAFLSIA